MPGSESSYVKIPGRFDYTGHHLYSTQCTGVLPAHDPPFVYHTKIVGCIGSGSTGSTPAVHMLPVAFVNTDTNTGWLVYSDTQKYAIEKSSFTSHYQFTSVEDEEDNTSFWFKLK